MRSSDVGLAKDKDWKSRVATISEITGKDLSYVHDALIYFDGNDRLCII